MWGKQLFSQGTDIMTWLKLDYRPMRPLHTSLKLHKSLKLQVYFKLIAHKRKTKYVS